MAVTATNQTLSLGADVIHDNAPGLTAVEDVTGGAGTWYTIVYKSGDANTAYLKLFDSADITPGTTQPNWILQMKPNDTTVWTVPDGVTFTNGLSYFVSEENGKEATTAPSGTNKLTIIVKRS
mgnify:FL=1|tara:strand:+ start:604 stop:972 length:369 start_codon:yes stop_codon:yes gene_type:complete